MSKKKERDDILNSIEDEYRHDLSLHLYSTFLFHQINPLFPRRNWSSWPLPFDRVPDPRTSKLFVDSEFSKDQLEDIGHGAQPEKENANIEQLTDTEDESEDEASNATDISEEEHDTTSQRPYMRIRSVATQETLSNSKVDIMIELHALLEKKIHEKLKNVAHERSLTMSSDISSNLTKEVCKKVANKVDQLVNNIINFQKQSNIRLSSDRPYPRLLNWQDILLAGLDVDESHDKILDTERHSNLYHKLDKLFNNPSYPYEYDTETDTETVLDEELVSNVNKKPKFNYLDYLSRVEETHSGIINYSNFKSRVLKNRNLENRLQELKKLIYMGKLNLQSKYSNLSWNDIKKRSQSGELRAPKKFRIRNEDKNTQREDALAHGGLQLTAEDFTANI